MMGTLLGAVLVLLMAADAQAQSSCALLPGELGIAESVVLRADESLGQVAPDEDPGFLMRSGSAWVAAPGVVVAAAGNVPGGDRDITFVPDGGDPVTCYQVGTSEDPDLAFLRCKDLDRPPAGVRTEPLAVGDPVYVPAAGANRVLRADGADYQVEVGGSSDVPVYDGDGRIVGIVTGVDVGEIGLGGQVEQCPTTYLTALPDLAEQAGSFTDRPDSFSGAMAELFLRRMLILAVPLVLVGLLVGRRRGTGALRGAARWGAFGTIVVVSITAVQWVAFGVVTTPI